MPLNISLREDEGGVSELVGTILTLSITVVLFTSVFAAVNNLEQPEEREHAELDATFERSENKAYVNITHQSGESLQMEQLTFALFVDGVVYRYDEDDVVLDGDDPWSPGEKVMIEESHSDVLSSSNIDIVVRNDENGRVVYDSTLVDLEEEPLSIERMDIKFVYDWRDYAEPGEEIDIRADISVSEELDENDLEVRADIPGKDIFEEEEPVTLERLRGNLFNKTVTIQSGAEVRRHSLRIIAELGSEKAEEYTNLNIGEETVDIYQPDLVVGDIDFSPGSPTHGDEFTVIGNIYNYGRMNYTAEWEIKDDGEVKKEGVTTFAPGPAPTRIRGNFDLEDHGAHDIEVNVSTTLHLEEDMSGETEEDVKPEDNVRELTVHVDPHIALVRDSLGDELREGRLMENALRGLNLDYRVRTIRSEDDIPDDADEFRKELNESSVIIWMTGNRTEDETEDDVIHIGNDVVKEAVHDFIVDDEGEFWLIGSNLDEADYSPHLYPKLGFKGFETNNKGLGSETVLEPGGDNGTYGDYNYTVKPGEDYLPMNVKDDAEDNNTLINPGPNDIYGVGYEENEGERTAVNSFLFENVMDSGQRMNMVSEVIEWLTSMTTRTGVDVAVSSQDIEPEAPMYMDEVTITATLRNNGPEDLYVNVRCVRNKGEEVLSPEEGEAIYVPKNGGTNTTTFKWMAEDLGVQEFIVHADYFDEIDEVNEENNQITYKDLEVTDDVVEINVHYSTLVVDADLSESSAYDHNATADVIDSFEQLDHKKGRDYDYYQVGMSGSDPEDGPDYDTMSEYNAVFWITGERESRVLTSADMDNLEQYVEQDSGANVMFIGEHILEDLSGNDFLEDMMGIDPDSIGEEESSELIGQEDNNLSHGLEYELDGSAELDTFDTSGAEVLFEDGEGNNLASIYDDGLKKVVYMGANLSRVSGPLVDEEKYEDWPEGEVDLGHENARDEFVYTTMWQLGKRDERTELRVIDHDIEFTTGEPHTGRSYEIRADIQNLGYGGASALIRIKDGGDYIGAESIFIEGSERISEEGSTYFEVEPGTATLEITWRPNHGGYRDIRVRVDPLRRTKEIAEDGESREDKLMEFHNQASVKQPVYFFHDDMEEGTEDWDNERMLMNIDGTGPLDFIDREDAQTDVVGEWDESLSGSTDGSDVYTLDQDTDDAGVYETDDEEVEAFTDKAHYSSPRSFWMPEVEGVDERKPIDLVIVLDYSGSMADEEGDMEDAATAAVGLLSDQDRVAVFPFSSDPWTSEEIPFTYCTQSNKDAINQTIRSWSTGGYTALYDTTARAGEYLEAEGRSGDVVKGFIGMTDGASNSDDDYYDHAPDDSGKDYYAYQNDWESTSVDWDGYDSPYTAETLSVNNDNSQYGCLGMPWHTNAVGLGGSVDEEWKWVGWSGGDSEPSGAQTSKINWYNHTNDPGELEEIFKHFVESIQEEAGEIKSTSPPSDFVGEKDEDISLEEEYDISKRDYRFFTTDPVEIKETTDVSMSFRNKFWMTEGTNGGVLYLLGSNDPDQWDWEQDKRLYVKPEQSYTGNLRFDGVDSDSDDGGPLAEDTGLRDVRGELPYWCFNGRSAGETFDWRYDQVDIGRYLAEYQADFDYDYFRVMFLYARYGGIESEEGWKPPMGWYIDNVRLKTSASWEEEDGHWFYGTAEELEEEGLTPYGGLENYYDHTLGTKNGHFWMFGDLDGNGRDYIPRGVDSSLYTAPISLSNAENPELIAHLKFNIDPGEGVPPDGLRVEVSDDDGRSWESLTYGVRSGWGASGDSEHGGYSGETEDGDYGWVNSGTLVRLNSDLSGWRGEQIRLRFRVFTNTSTTDEDHYEDPNLPRAIFIDDVIVKEQDMEAPLSADIEEDSIESKASGASDLSEEVANTPGEMQDGEDNIAKDTVEPIINFELSTTTQKYYAVPRLPNHSRYGVNEMDTISFTSMIKEVRP